MTLANISDCALRRPLRHLALVGQFPPPVHGQSLAIQQLAEAGWTDVAVHPVRLDMSDSLDQVGRASVLKLLRLWRCIRRTRRVLRRHAPCVLYYPPGDGRLVPFLRDVLFLLTVRRQAAATVLHYHAAGMGAYVMASPLRRWTAGFFRAAEIAVQPGPSCLPDAELLEAREIRYIPTGIPDPGNRVGGRSSTPAERFRVLVVGHLCPGKGTGLLPRIAERLSDTADIEIMGDWRSAAYQTQMEPGLRYGHVRFLGVCEGEEKWDAFARADVLLFPSLQETQGLVAVEAMACGLPLVASDIDGIRDVVRDGVEGCLVPPGDADRFADAIGDICSDSATWRAMSEAGRQRYLAEYTLPVYRERMRQVFLDCLPAAADNAGQQIGKGIG